MQKIYMPSIIFLSSVNIKISLIINIVPFKDIIQLHNYTSSTKLLCQAFSMKKCDGLYSPGVKLYRAENPIDSSSPSAKNLIHRNLPLDFIIGGFCCPQKRPMIGEKPKGPSRTSMWSNLHSQEGSMEYFSSKCNSMHCLGAARDEKKIFLLFSNPRPFKPITKLKKSKYINFVCILMFYVKTCLKINVENNGFKQKIFLRNLCIWKTMLSHI